MESARCVFKAACLPRANMAHTTHAGRLWSWSDGVYAWLLGVARRWCGPARACCISMRPHSWKGAEPLSRTKIRIGLTVQSLETTSWQVLSRFTAVYSGKISQSWKLGPIEAWLSNAGSARAQAWRKLRLKALPPFIPSPPNPGQRWRAVPRSCHRRRHFPPVHPEFPSGSILCVPSAQRMPDGQQARSKCISAQRAATDPISWGDSGQNSESPLCAVSAASCLNFPRGPVWATPHLWVVSGGASLFFLNLRGCRRRPAWWARPDCGGEVFPSPPSAAPVEAVLLISGPNHRFCEMGIVLTLRCCSQDSTRWRMPSSRRVLSDFQLFRLPFVTLFIGNSRYSGKRK